MAAADVAVHDQPLQKRNREEKERTRARELEGKEGVEAMFHNMMYVFEDSTGSIKESIEGQKEQVKRVEATVEKQGSAIASLQDRQTALETMVSNMQKSAPTTSGPSSGGAPVAASPTGSPVSPSLFTPAFIELKGWVTNWNDRTARSEQMLLWSDCKQIVDNVIKILGEDDATYICPDTTERVNAG
eukprot:129986-Pyramimonas_sp.AAC.1